MKRIAMFAGLLVPVLALSGCGTVYGRKAANPVQPAGQSIEGNWVDANGIVSSFSSGTFETRTTDTNSVLATGTYSYTSDKVVAIDLHSRVRNTDSSANCALINPTQLNCTSSTGAQFSLVRNGAPKPTG